MQAERHWQKFLSKKEVKLHPITYDPINHHYIELGDVVGSVFADDKALK